MANPPFSHVQRFAVQQRTYPQDALNPFEGGSQPLAPRKFPPSLLSVDNPLFGHRMRDGRFQNALVRAWDPPPSSYQFFGGRQPYELGKLPPILIDWDSPPGRPWEVEVYLEPDYHTPYLLAQRRYKVIGSATVSSADLSSAGVATATWSGSFTQPVIPKTIFQKHILRAWDEPVSVTISLPQLSVGSTASDFQSTGVGTATWVGSFTQPFIPKSTFQKHITRAWDEQPRTPIARQKLPSISSSTTGDLSSAGTGTATWNGTFTQPYIPKAIFQKHILTGWQEPSVVTISLPQLSFNFTSASGDFSSTGASTAIWVGFPPAPSTILKTVQQHIVRSWDPPPPSPFEGGRQPLARAKLAPKLLGEPAASGPPGYIWELVEFDSEDTATYFRVQPRYKVSAIPVTKGDLSSAGVGTARWTGAETASGAFLDAGHATAIFVGRGRAEEERHDGRRHQRETLERRRRKDELEIATILAAVLPLLQRGTVSQPTRISVPRNGGTTLQ